MVRPGDFNGSTLSWVSSDGEALMQVLNTNLETSSQGTRLRVFTP